MALPTPRATDEPLRGTHRPWDRDGGGEFGSPPSSWSRPTPMSSTRCGGCRSAPIAHGRRFACTRLPRDRRRVPRHPFALIDAIQAPLRERRGGRLRGRTGLLPGRRRRGARDGDGQDRLHRGELAALHRGVPRRLRTGCAGRRSRTSRSSSTSSIRPSLGLDPEGGYLDPGRGRDIAAALYDEGVDIIFVAAGGSGQGVIEAAAALSTPERKLWAIGVDTDQYFDISKTSGTTSSRRCTSASTSASKRSSPRMSPTNSPEPA